MAPGAGEPGGLRGGQLIAGSSVSQVADNNCQMVELCGSKLPPNKEASPAPEKLQSGQNTQAWKKLKVRKQLNKAPRGKARGQPSAHSVPDALERTSRKIILRPW